MTFPELARFSDSWSSTANELTRFSESFAQLLRPLEEQCSRFARSMAGALEELRESAEYRAHRRRQVLARRAVEAAQRAESENARVSRVRLLELLEELPEERPAPVLTLPPKRRVPLVAGWSSHAPPARPFFTRGAAA